MASYGLGSVHVNKMFLIGNAFLWRTPIKADNLLVAIRYCFNFKEHLTLFTKINID